MEIYEYNKCNNTQNNANKSKGIATGSKLGPMRAHGLYEKRVFFNEFKIKKKLSFIRHEKSGM